MVTVTVTHEGDLYNGADGRTFAVCSVCAWAGPERVTEDRAERDLEIHVLEAAEGEEYA